MIKAKLEKILCNLEMFYTIDFVLLIVCVWILETNQIVTPGIFYFNDPVNRYTHIVLIHSVITKLG